MPTTLLFVDDNIELVKAATRFVGEIRPQWRFLLAHNLEEGRRIYNLNSPDVAVLDVDLPDGSGLDLLSEFKRKRPELPIIVISGDAPEALQQIVMERGGYSFLAKPFSVPVLVNQIELAISASLDKSPTQTTPTLENDGIWRNPNALVLRSASQEPTTNNTEAIDFNWLPRRNS